MSIIDQNGEPVAYGWNEIAAQEKIETNPHLRAISDEEFERLFPQLTVHLTQRNV